jgi:hypothetical protein
VRIIDPPHPRIFESWEPYKDFFFTDSRGWVVPDIDKIQRLGDQYDFVIVNCSTEHWGSEQDFPLVARLHDLLAEHHGKDFVCLCHEPSDEKLREQILFFPFFYHLSYGDYFPHWDQSPMSTLMFNMHG